MKQTNSTINDDYEWTHHQDLHKYQGKWIAVVNQKILCSGQYADDVVREVKKRSIKTPLLMKVASEKYLFL